MNPELDQYLKKTVQTLKSQGKSDDVIKAETEKVYNKYMEMNSTKAGASAPIPENDLNFFQSLVLPFGKVGATVTSLAQNTESLVRGAFGQDTTKLDEEIRKGYEQGYDHGALGNVRPFGAASNLKGDVLSWQDAAEAAGTGAEIGSYFTPMKVPKFNGGFFRNILTSLKTVAPFAAPFAAGKTLEAAGEGKSAGESIMEGAGAYMGAAIGFNLLRGGGNLLGYAGARLMRNPIIKAQTEKLADLADALISSVSSKTQKNIGENIDWNSRMYQKEFDTAHKKVVDSVINEFSAEAPTGEAAYQGYQQNLRKYVTSQYNKKTTDFADVFSSPYKVEEYGATKMAVDKAKKEVDTLIKSGLYESGQNLQNYIGRVENILGNKFNKPQTLKVVDALYSAADTFTGKSNAEDALIRDISHSLLDDATLSVSKGEPKLLDRWNQARNFSQDISTNVNSDFAGKMKNAPKLNNFVDNLVDGSGPSREEVAAFNKAFNSGERKDISQSIFNSLISRTKNAKTLEEGATLIDKALKNLNQYGDDNIIEAGHAAQLESLSDLMKSNFDDFLFRTKNNFSEPITKTEADIGGLSLRQTQQGLAEDVVKMAQEGRYSEIGDKISKMTGTEEVKAVLKLVGDNPDLQKGVGSEIMRGILTDNKTAFLGKDGKYDFSRFFDDLSAIGGPNKDEIFNLIFTPEQKGYIDNLFKIKDEIGTLENMQGENLLKVAHGITGLLYTFTRKPVPATYHLSQIAKVSNRNKIPYARLKELSEEISSMDGAKFGDLLTKFGDKLKGSIFEKIGAVSGGDIGS